MDQIVFYSKLNESFELPNQPSRCKWHLKAKKEGVHCPHTSQGWKNVPKSKICPNINAAIGNTPLVKLNRIPQAAGLKCNVYGKCEFMNPGGSAKDRVAKRMIEDAELHGILKPGMTVIESSSGNAGIALSLQAAIKGYKAIIIISEFSQISPEKLAVLTALGAEIVRTPFTEDLDSPDGFIGAATKLHKQIPNSIILDQFTNPASPLAHYDTTAEEILDQLDGKVDMVVIGAGTGGTTTGIGRKLKERQPSTKIIGVDPVGSTIALPEELNETDDNYFEVDGIGFCFVSPVLDRSVVDKWYKTTDKESMVMARRMISEEGLLVGNSSGAILSAALRAAKDLDENQNVVVMLPDGVRNYLSSFLFDPWMEYRGYQKPLNKNKHWWWNKPVGELNIGKIFNVDTDDTCRQVLDIMKYYQLNNVAVLGPDCELAGMISQKDLVRKLLENEIHSTDRIENVMSRHYLKAELNSSLGLVSRLFEIQDSVVIVKKEGTGSSQIDVPLGIIQNIDILKYVEKHERLEFSTNYTKKVVPDIAGLQGEVLLNGKILEGRSEGRS